jgi:ATP-binding cassette subfamily A (ABC1) protein 3
MLSRHLTRRSWIISSKNARVTLGQQSIEVKALLSVLASLFILIPFCYIPGAFIVFVVKERDFKSKHVQLVSGVGLAPFWIAHYLWDLSLYLGLTVCMMVMFLVYSLDDAAEVFVGDAESFLATMLLTLGYGFSILPFSYLLSMFFSNHSSAQILSF